MFKGAIISQVAMEAFPAIPIHGNISLEKQCMEGFSDPGPGISISL